MRIEPVPEAAWVPTNFKSLKVIFNTLFFTKLKANIRNKGQLIHDDPI